ncbi:uncharacterized protein TNCV_854721 [Trichonephila clavipes]|nr:uncharacterized protein TNCV_854721 [Trichonephila clavipes]
MDVCKCIVPLRHGGTLNSRPAASPLVRLVEGEERQKLFREDRERVEDDVRFGRSSTSKTNQNAVNAVFYLEALTRLRKRIARVLPAIANRWRLHHDNAPIHTAFRVVEYLAQHRVVTVSHPSYSADLALPGFFLFSSIKLTRKGNYHGSVEAVQLAVTSEQNSIPIQEFLEVYVHWKLVGSSV